MEKFAVDGVILKTSVTGESDRIVHILTPTRGIIRAFAKGARGSKSKLRSVTEQFAYCGFVLYEKNSVYNVTEATEKEIFFELRSDLKKLSLAQYFCEVLLRTVTGDISEPEYLKLLLNSLYVLCKDKKSASAVKAVFELRITSISGYAPALVACDKCGKYETDEMFFDCFNGKLYCSDCGKTTGTAVLPLSVISAMRHIVFSPPERIFAFEMSDEALSRLERITERYEENCFQQKFRSLDFYKTLV